MEAASSTTITGEVVRTYSERDDGVPGSVTKEVLDFLGQRYSKSSPYEKRVLELGVGAGSIMTFLRDKFGDNKVIGMDIRDKLIRDEKIRKCLLAGEKMILPVNQNSVEVIVSLHFFESSFDLENILCEVERILIPGGEATLVIPRTGKKGEPGVGLPGETKLGVDGFKEISVPGEVGDAWIITLKKKK